MEVPCITCDAAIGEACYDQQYNVILLKGFHARRVELRERYPNFPTEQELTPTDKALLCFYAFVMLSDSVAVNSVRLFGKQCTTEEVQRMFGSRALQALRSEGLLMLKKKEDNPGVAHQPATNG